MFTMSFLALHPIAAFNTTELNHVVTGRCGRKSSDPPVCALLMLAADCWASSSSGAEPKYVRHAETSSHQVAAVGLQAK